LEDSPYYIAPDGKVGQDAFAVIRDTIAKMNMVAIGRVQGNSWRDLGGVGAMIRMGKTPIKWKCAPYRVTGR
jgi:hypothetical protein